MWHGLAWARVELTAERLSVATVTQAKSKARFVAMVCSIASQRRIKRPTHYEFPHLRNVMAITNIRFFHQSAEKIFADLAEKQHLKKWNRH